jgi:hypothetical protein
MSEGVLIGHQFDKTFAAVGVQQQNVFAGHRAGFRPDLRMGAVGEGVLCVELKLVDLP